jgi:hypothetical protein
VVYRSSAEWTPQTARARVATARRTASLLQAVTSTSLTPEQVSVMYCRMSSMQPALMLWQPLRSTRFRFSEVTRTSATRASSSRTDSANPLRLSWGAVLRDLCTTVLQFLDTTSRRETSAKGRWVAKNAKSGSKASFDRMST